MMNVILGICLSLSIGTKGVSEEALVGTWKLIELSQDGKTTSVSDPIKVVFATEGKIGKFTGNTKGNLFSGLFNLKSKKQISIDGLMATKMKDSQLSADFLEAFESVDTYKLESDVLMLSDVEKSKLLKLKKVSN